jgi:hypothetical protein
MAFLCVSQQGEFKNTTRNFFGKIHVGNFLPKKLRGKKLFPVVFPAILKFSCSTSPAEHFYRRQELIWANQPEEWEEKEQPHDIPTAIFLASNSWPIHQKAGIPVC